MSNASIPYRKALVTGASSGIGKAICIELARQGIDTIVLVARNTERLNEVAESLPCNTQVITADLRDPDGVKLVLGGLQEVDLLINNAGFGSFGPFHEMDVTNQLSMVDLNCRTPIHLASKVLSTMVEQGHGCVVNIASGMSFQGMPYMSTYAATKAFLLHWSEAIHAEVRSRGVHVVAVCPGTIHTNFAQASSVPVKQIMGSSLVTGSVDEVVTATMSAIRTNRPTVVTGRIHRFVQFWNWLAPRQIVQRITAWGMARTHRQISG